MLIAGSTLPDGTRRLIVGLDTDALMGLVDKPIIAPLDDISGLAGWQLVILGPDEFAAMMAGTQVGPVV